MENPRTPTFQLSGVGLQRFDELTGHLDYGVDGDAVVPGAGLVRLRKTHHADERPTAAQTSGRFVKREQLGTLASQTEIGVWVRAPGTPAGVRGFNLRKNLEIVNVKSCNLCIFGVFKRFQQWERHSHAFFDSFSTVGTEFPRVPLEMTTGRDGD